VGDGLADGDGDGLGLGAGVTVMVNACVASGFTPLAAVMVRRKFPRLPSAGVPLTVAVPSPLSRKVTPPGSAPLALRLGVGKPSVVTRKLPGWRSVNVVVLALVIAGASLTVCAALPPLPLKLLSP
jgi:hypothetical protein